MEEGDSLYSEERFQLPTGHEAARADIQSGNILFLSGIKPWFFDRPSHSNKKTPWSESASKLYRPGDRRLSEKLVPTFADRGNHVVSVTDPYGRILVF
jgi:hypothetical protein